MVVNTAVVEFKDLASHVYLKVDETDMSNRIKPTVHVVKAICIFVFVTISLPSLKPILVVSNEDAATAEAPAQILEKRYQGCSDDPEQCRNRHKSKSKVHGVCKVKTGNVIKEE
ncbi:hypothetical protein BG000_005089 [Podila horticola]|nr:hypothetical protein BG000_005089 [Podila horticola]